MRKQKGQTPASLLPSAPPSDRASPDPASPAEWQDVLETAGIRPWCRGLLIILAHPQNLTLQNVIDAVTTAAESGGLTRCEAALLAEVKAGAIAREAQTKPRIVAAYEG